MKLIIISSKKSVSLQYAGDFSSLRYLARTPLPLVTFTTLPLFPPFYTTLASVCESGRQYFRSLIGVRVPV